MSSAQTHSFDFIVLGSGVAGLTYALEVAHRGKVAIITKKNRADSNTNWAQGGIASVTSREDSFELHVQDTLEAGAGLCRESVVRTIVEEGPERIAELMASEELASLRPELDGQKVMELLGVPAGPIVGAAMEFLMDIRLEEGLLGEDAAIARLKQWWKENEANASKLRPTRRINRG